LDLLTGIVVWGGVALASAIAGGVVASAKNRDYSAWTAWCFLLPPLVLILLALPRRQGVRGRRALHINAEQE
jgi:hypothetical protein